MVQRQCATRVSSAVSTLRSCSRDSLRQFTSKTQYLAASQRRTLASSSRSQPSSLSLLSRFSSKPSSWQPQTRAFSSTPQSLHGDLTPPKPGEERKITFIDKDGQEYTFEVADGNNLLDIAQANDLEMEGACGGSCACSTCHVIVEDDAMFDKMEEPSDDENDMLDLAFGLTETSRLGCQVEMSKELDGLRVKLPSMTRNLQASDFADK